VRLPARRCTPRRLRSAVAGVVREPRYRDNARRIADLLAAAPGPAGAATLLERLVASTPSRALAQSVPGGTP
jgi:UDP:flavonoid glycosyltransferase YjiC (YdhE family)